MVCLFVCDFVVFWFFFLIIGGGGGGDVEFWGFLMCVGV